MPELHDFELPVDDDGLLKSVWLLDHWKLAHKRLLMLSGSLLDRLFRRSWLLMVLLPLRAGWFLQALLAFGGRVLEALRGSLGLLGIDLLRPLLLSCLELLFKPFAILSELIVDGRHHDLEEEGLHEFLHGLDLAPLVIVAGEVRQ